MVHDDTEIDEDGGVAIPPFIKPTETRVSKNPSFPATISEASKARPKPTETGSGPDSGSNRKL